MANMDGSTFCIFKFLLRENHRIADELGSSNNFRKSNGQTVLIVLPWEAARNKEKSFEEII